ncbi:hypothetical protein ACWPKO_29945 (plasmid) [Coraliomargarita sp. W4R53]
MTQNSSTSAFDVVKAQVHANRIVPSSGLSRLKSFPLVALAAAILVVSFLSPSPASAATVSQALASCPSGAACLWADGNYTTYNSISGRLYLFYYVGNLSSYNYAGPFPPSGPINAGNSASSLVNNGNSDDLYLFTGTFKQGNGFILPKKLGISLSSAGSYNNNLESVYFKSCLDGVCG